MDIHDIFEGPDPSDPPEDEDLLDQVEAAIVALAEKLRVEPTLMRTEAMTFVKSVAPECSLFFGALIWPAARETAGLPRNGKRGRPKKTDVSFSADD